MSSTHHTPVATGAAANAATVNTPLGQLDAVLATAYAELIAGRGPYANLDARLDSIIASGGQVVATLASSTSTTTVAVGAGEGSGFTVGAHVGYIISGSIRYNTVAAKAANSITLGTSPGGTIASGSLIFQITDSEYQSAFSVNAAASGVNRTLPNAMTWAAADTFNVLAYGALGNGIADDVLAIQAAVDAAEGNGTGTVLIPEGEYLLSTWILVNNPNITIQGVGRPRLVASSAFNSEATDPQAGVIFLSGVHHITVRDLEIYAGDAVASTGLMARDSDHCLISNVTVDGTVTATTQSGAAIGFYGACNYNRIEYCEVYNAGYSGYNVAQDDDPVSNQPIGNVLFANYAQDCAQDGFDIYRTKNTVIIGNYITGSGRMGINLAHDGNATYPNDECLIQGNYVASGLKHGIHLEQQGTRCRIIGNFLKSNAWNGINVPGFGNNDCLIANNVCYGNQQHGILCGENFATIVGNKCKENGSSSIYHGIYLHDEADGSSAVGNHCTGNGGAGITVLDCDDVTVNSNVCYGNNLDGIHLENGSELQCNDNRTLANLNHGIAVAGCARPQINNNYCSANGQATHNTYDNIRIQSSTIQASIQGNKCHRGDGGNRAKYGIRIEDSSCVDNFVSNNDLYLGGATAELSNAGTTTRQTSGNRLSHTGLYTPEVWGTTANPTVGYTAQTGRYIQDGNLCFYHLDIVINTISGGNGNVRIPLPLTALSGNSTYVNSITAISGVDLPGTPVQVFANIVGGQAYADLYISQDNGAQVGVPVSGLAAGDTISITGFYFVP